MRLPIIKQCCCGCSLRKVTLIIGYLHALLFAVVLHVVIVFTPNDDFYYPKDSIVAEGFALFAALMLLISIFLIVGATRRKMILLLPWIGNAMAGVIASAFAWVYGLIKVGVTPVAALVTFGFFSVVGISLLSLLVVVSHFEELRIAVVDGGRTENRRAQNVEERIAALEATVDNLGQSI